MLCNQRRLGGLQMSLSCPAGTIQLDKVHEDVIAYGMISKKAKQKIYCKEPATGLWSTESDIAKCTDKFNKKLFKQRLSACHNKGEC